MSFEKVFGYDDLKNAYRIAERIICEYLINDFYSETYSSSFDDSSDSTKNIFLII